MQMFENLQHTMQTTDRWWHGVVNHVQSEFLKEFTGTYFFSKKINIESRCQIDEIVDYAFDSIKKIAGFPTCSYFEPHHVVIRTSKVILFIKKDGGRYEEQTVVSKINKFFFEAYGQKQHVVDIIKIIEDKFYDTSFTRVNWYYKDPHGVDGCSLYIEQDSKVNDEFYPWLTSGVDAFIDDYMNSKSSVLVMYGPPGTGKTSFLKHMLCNRKLSAAVSYDEAVLNDDRFFIDFLTSSENDVLIIEDADLLLTSRESDQNRLMSKFLNVSDGLVKVNDKKMIFTTNIAQLSKVDQALLRKGRCFAAVEFRKLSSKEARIAASAANLQDQDWGSKRDWSLAEIFNADVDVVEQQPKPKFGFV